LATSESFHFAFSIFQFEFLIMSEKFESSKTSGVHYQLSRLVGEWEGTATTWFEAGKIGDQSPVQGTMRLILGSRFILHEYQGSMQGKRIEGMMILGYHLGLGKIQSAWVDSFHNGTAIMFSEGPAGSTDLDMKGTYAYVTPEKIHYWGWRTEVEITGDNSLRITAYNISPEGEETKATETLYQRR
jgi:hypothetical protein